MSMNPESSDPGPPQRLAARLNRFAFRLFAQLSAAQPEANLFLSPSSIATALAMTHLGAAGNTRAELAALLECSSPDENLLQAFRELSESTRTGGVDLRVANGLWGQLTFQFRDEFLRDVEQQFGVGLEQVDFRDPRAASDRINDWIEEQTCGMLKDVVSPNNIHQTTRLVLASAVYFLGTWESPFKEQDTTAADFHVGDSETVTVQMMYRRGSFLFAESDRYKVLRLPYRSHDERALAVEGPVDMEALLQGGSDFAMEIVLPHADVALDDVLPCLSDDESSALPSLTTHDVRVRLPQFKMDSSMWLAETLQSLGVSDPFDDRKADFSVMTDDPEGLFISDVLHQARIAVDEEGTEAAAVTIVLARAMAATEPSPPAEFRADRPFLFLIRDTTTGLVHFIGKFLRPQSNPEVPVFQFRCCVGGVANPSLRASEVACRTGSTRDPRIRARGVKHLESAPSRPTETHSAESARPRRTRPRTPRPRSELGGETLRPYLSVVGIEA